MGIGTAHYFGDLNPFLGQPKPGYSLSVFSRHSFNPYLAYRLQLAYIHTGYADKLSRNPVRKLRNLSFTTDIYEASAQVDFNFFQYIPGQYGYNFTPYLTMGLGLFYFHSYTRLNDQKIALRPLKTEGVSYWPVAVSVPVGIGMKWGLSPKVNISAELSYRFTATDYIDDVSGNYKEASSFQDPVARLLQDRSYTFGKPIGVAEKQRGQSKAKDSYLSLELLISINIYKYYCPKARL